MRSGASELLMTAKRCSRRRPPGDPPPSRLDAADPRGLRLGLAGFKMLPCDWTKAAGQRPFVRHLSAAQRPTERLTADAAPDVSAYLADATCKRCRCRYSDTLGVSLLCAVTVWESKKKRRQCSSARALMRGCWAGSLRTERHGRNPGHIQE